MCVMKTSASVRKQLIFLKLLRCSLSDLLRKRIKKYVFALQMFARVAKYCVAGNILLVSCVLSGPGLEHTIEHVHVCGLGTASAVPYCMV